MELSSMDTSLGSVVVDDEITKIDENLKAEISKVEEKFLVVFKYIKETEENIERYVVQQLHNNKILHLYIEKELILNQMHNDIVIKQIKALSLARWWQKITKKQREKILVKAEKEVKEEYQPIINDIQKRLQLATNEIC